MSVNLENPPPPEKLIIGTRGSPLALWQASKVVSEIARIGCAIDVEVKVIKTSGDWQPEHGERALNADAGGKALFAKELEEALLAGAIDVAVHSMKDMETRLPEGLVIPFMLPRADVRDVFLSPHYASLSDMPAGASIGTTSARRAAYVAARYPNLSVLPLRGNVRTRIEKMEAGVVGATFLAYAGLERLDMLDEVRSIMNVDEMLPAVGQGAIGVEMRSEDQEKLAFIGQLSCAETFLCVSAERALLRGLGGSCHTPVGVYAVLDGKDLWVRAEVLTPNGGTVWRVEERQAVYNIQAAETLGLAMGRQLKAIVPEGVL